MPSEHPRNLRSEQASGQVGLKVLILVFQVRYRHQPQRQANLCCGMDNHQCQHVASLSLHGLHQLVLPETWRQCLRIHYQQHRREVKMGEQDLVSLERSFENLQNISLYMVAVNLRVEQARPDLAETSCLLSKKLSIAICEWPCMITLVVN